ncbi:MAG: hypothetical protein ABDH19_03085 [Thermodesulfovibrio sp.]
MKEAIKKISIILFVVVLLFYVKSFITQRHLISQAEKAENPISAIRYYERTLLSYVPLSPYNKEAIEGIIDKCKKLSDLEQRLYCYETLRSALYQIRSFYQPYKEEIKNIEPLIAELKAKQMIQWKYNNFSEKDYEYLYNYHIEILKYDSSPSLVWSALSVFSLILWIFSVFLGIVKGFGFSLNKKYLIISFIGFILFFSLWIIGLYNA